MNMKVSIDGGVTFVAAPQGVRIIYENMPVPGEDEPGELHFNATHEGLVTDVYVTRDEPLDHNIGTSSKLHEDTISDLVDENA